MDKDNRDDGTNDDSKDGEEYEQRSTRNSPTTEFLPFVQLIKKKNSKW